MFSTAYNVQSTFSQAEEMMFGYEAEEEEEEEAVVSDF